MNLIRRAFFLIVVSLLFNTCAKRDIVDDAKELQFIQLSEDFLNGYFTFRPAVATYLGLHQYDRAPRHYDKVAIHSELSRLKDFEKRFSDLQDSVSRKTAFDVRLLLAAVRQEIFNIEDIRSFETNPMTYAGNIGLNIF